MEQEAKKYKERKKRTPFQKLKPFTDAQRSLMAEWYPWAMNYALTEINRRTERSNIPEYVIKDAAINALIHAAVRWNPEYGVSFKTYFHKGFYMSVWNAVKEYCESRDNHISENAYIRSTPAAQKNCENDLMRLNGSSLFSDGSFEDDLCDKIDIDQLLSKLTPLQSESVRRFYIYGEKQSDIARDMGVSRQNVGNAISVAKRYMRMMYNGEVDRIRRGRKKKDA